MTMKNKKALKYPISNDYVLNTQRTTLMLSRHTSSLALSQRGDYNDYNKLLPLIYGY